MSGLLGNDSVRDEDLGSWYVLYILQVLDRCLPVSFFFPLADFLLCNMSHLPPPTLFHSISIIGHLQHTMIPAQVQC